MNESDWLNCDDPQSMLSFLRERGEASDRKLRLFAVACCRRIWHLFADETVLGRVDDIADLKRCRDAVALAERFADGQATEQELAAMTDYPRPVLYAKDAAMEAAEVMLNPPDVAADAAEAAGMYSAALLQRRLFPTGYKPAPENKVLLTQIESECERVVAVEEQSQCSLLRCLFGNAFRPPPPLPSSCLTPEVMELATTIYERRDFTRLPELADTLAAAGCTEAELLAHLRSSSEAVHVRGCWAVDAVLHKA
jgi:hypothetical protein